MNRLIISAPTFLLLAVVSCTKSNVTQNSAIDVPWNMDSLMPTTNAVYAYASYIHASGVLIASSISGNLIDTTGRNNLYKRNWAAALFSKNDGSMAVSLNRKPLVPEQDAYIYYDGLPVMEPSALNNWSVSGSSTIPSFSADISGTMPSFIGKLPVNIDTATDFSFTFNAANTAFADSAYAVIYTGGSFWYSNVVSANGGTAVLNAKFMRYCSNNYISLTGLDRNATVYYGGLIMLVLYNHFTLTFGGKKFVFVKQKEILGIVNFQ